MRPGHPLFLGWKAPRLLLQQPFVLKLAVVPAQKNVAVSYGRRHQSLEISP